VTSLIFFKKVYNPIGVLYKEASVNQVPIPRFFNNRFIKSLE